MGYPKIKDLKFVVQDIRLVPPWWVVAYKVIPWMERDLSQLAVVNQTKFETVVKKYLKDFVVKQKQPPADIATAIMNMADDVLDGRQVTIRAGDYQALQNHVRGMSRTRRAAPRKTKRK